MGYRYTLDKWRANETIGYPITAYRMDNPRYFELSVEEVPVEVCKMILQTEWKLPIVIKVGNEYVQYGVPVWNEFRNRYITVSRVSDR